MSGPGGILRNPLGVVAKMSGTATLASGTVTVADATITSNSKILLKSSAPAGTPGALFISSQTAGTGFVIKSTSSTDTSVVAYEHT